MNEFKFLIGLKLSENTLKMTDNLSRTLQKTALSTAETQRLASLTVRTLQGLRMVEAWDCEWLKLGRRFTPMCSYYKRSSVSVRQFFPEGRKLPDDSDGNSDGFTVRRLRICIMLRTLKPLTWQYPPFRTDLISLGMPCIETWRTCCSRLLMGGLQ